MDKGNDDKIAYEITKDERWAEEVYYKLDTHEYVLLDGKIYDDETGDLVCLLSELRVIDN